MPPKPVHGSWLVALLVLAAAAAAVAAADASGVSQHLLAVRFLGFNGSLHGWTVEARLDDVSCRGVVAVNLAYRESRSISRGLLVAPLYYVLVSACGAGRVAGWASSLEGPVRVVFEAPGGYRVRSGLDWRGYGPQGGPYTVPGRLLRRFYLYDGVVVAGPGYVVEDLEALNMSLVAPWRAAGRAAYAAHAAAAVRSVVSQLLGPSPRSPVVAVVARPGEFEWLLPGVGYSLGGVFLVYPEPGSTAGWLVHVAAHEAVHGWLNDGLLYGDFSLAEAATEWLAVLGLWRGNRSLYRAAEPYIGSLVDYGESYSVWMRVHALLWETALRECGWDAYSSALAGMFRESINGEPGERLYSLVDLVESINETCGPKPLEDWARLLPGAKRLNVTALLEEATRIEAGKTGGGAVEEPSPHRGEEGGGPTPPTRIPGGGEAGGHGEPGAAGAGGMGPGGRPSGSELRGPGARPGAQPGGKEVAGLHTRKPLQGASRGSQPLVAAALAAAGILLALALKHKR